MKKNNNGNLGVKTKKEKRKTWLSRKPVLKIVIKSLIIITGFFLIVRHIDAEGYFNPDESNNHTKKKWNSYYDFTKKNNVDIILVGNSHLYSGINPKNLSNALGCNAFILASPGTNIADSYFGLKEALKRTEAKLIIVETYGIRDFDPYNLKQGPLSSQLKSFSARKDFKTKIGSLPFLFSPENYLYAWSNTLRNHDFIFNDTTQLSINKKIITENKRKKRNKNKLYLGRFVRFQSGITNELINKYDSLGAPVKGKEYKYNNMTEKYVNKIVNLCQKEGVELIFLTLPMFEKHISDYDEWEKKIAEIIGKDSYHWINMQNPPGYNGFGSFAFENTYEENQHMTYNGSLIATYKLADYIRDSLHLNLPDRSKNRKWKNLFYAEEGYFENYSPKENDKDNFIICTNKNLRNIQIKSLLVTKKKEANRLIAKVEKKLLNKITKNKKIKLRLIVKFEFEGIEKIANIDLTYDKFHRSKNEIIFTSMIKPIVIKEVLDGMLYKF
tara:strand:- start:74 stop:1570 length:1497 start_codon:yes stop_codon:yes gene_type:complete